MKYVFDTNIFINLQRRQPIDLYPSLWEKLDQFFKTGVIVSSQEVFDEITSGRDELADWVFSRKEFFLPTDSNVQKKAREILKDNRGLIEGGKKANSADPFVIALAQILNAKVVTEEAKSSNLMSPKIPDVCERLGIEHISFVSFSRELHLQF